MKKTLSFLLVLCLMFGLATSAFAATVTPAADGTVTSEGEVVVTLTLDEDMTDVLTLSYKLYYDSSLFTYKEKSCTIPGVTVSAEKKDAEGKTYVNLSWMDTTSEGLTITAGELGTLTFTAAAVEAETPAEFKVAFENCYKTDLTEPTYDDAVASISVTVKPAAPEVVEDGTAEHPYLIKTAADFIALSDLVKGGDNRSGIYYELANDIDMSDVTDYIPVGTSNSRYDTKQFSGYFNGKGHKVTLNVGGDNVYYGGLFGVVKNATIENVVVAGTIKGKNYTGGVVGYSLASTLRNLGNEATVTTSANGAGGIAGYIGGDMYTTTPTTMESCYNHGTVSVTTSGLVAGGIVGYAYGTSSKGSTITNCYNTGSVEASGGTAAGLVGKMNSNTGKLTVTNYFTTGELTGSTTYPIANDSYSGISKTNVYTSMPSASALGEAFKEIDGSTVLAWETTGSSAHKCTLELVKEVPATCTETGTKEHYKCSDATCGKLFADADGQTEITDEKDLIIPAAGHTYDDTLTCTVCRYVNPVLALIQEKAGAENFTAASSKTELWQATGTDGKTLEANGADTAVFTLTALKDGTLTVNTRILGMSYAKLTVKNGENETVLSTMSSTESVVSEKIDVKKGDVLTFTYSNDYASATAEFYYVQITSLNFTAAPVIVLTVNEKTADGTAVEKATFTKEALVEKATTSPTIGYQYWRGGAQNLVVTTQYVTLADLLGDISFGAGDKLLVKATDGYTNTYTYETLNTAKYYQAEENGALEEIPAALAIVWDSGAKTFEELEKTAYDSGSLRFGHGIAAGEYGSARGNRLSSKVSEITVVHPCENHTLADKVITAATCTETGVSTKYCTVCGYVSTETFTTPALGHELTYTANENGTHTAACSRCDYSVTEAHTYGEDNKCTLCNAEKPDFAGYTVAVTADPAEIAVGEESTVSLKVGHTDATVTTFNAYHFVLTYDAAKLTYKSTSLTDAKVTDNNGTLTILGYGDDKATAQAITVTFEGKAAGKASVAAAANIDAEENAHTQDAPEALVEPSSTEITVTAVYNVDLPDDFTGEPTVKHGEDYTFEAKDKNYDYDFGGSTMGGETVTVKDNGDGTFTVPGITGDLVIKSTKTGKTYNVTVSGSGKDDVTAADKATYGTDYSFSIAKEAGYNYTVTVTIGGTSHYVTENSGSYTISGSSITGDIEINVVKTTQTITTTTINFVGSGAADVKGGTSQTATIGQNFTFEINAETGFTYTVKLGETVIDPVNGMYTISGGLIGTDTVTVTVEKNAEYTVEVVEYVKAANAQSVFLVTVKGTPATGNVFAYGGEAMSHSAKYDAYAYLVFSGKTLAEVKTEAAAKITEITGTAAEIDYTGDVNVSKLIDVNDAQLVWNMYNAKYADFTTATMEMFLRADMNGDKTLNVNDATAVVNAIK